MNIVTFKNPTYFLKLINKGLMLRVSIYIIIASIYLAFMSQHAPLGINWRPFQQERVLNSVEHLLSGSPLLKYGLTSWDPLPEINSSIGSQEGIRTYVLNAYEYIAYALLSLLGGKSLLLSLGPRLDQATVAITAAVSAELIIHLSQKRFLINNTLIGFSVFTLFISSPWSYRMMLAPSHHLHFLLFFLLSALTFAKSMPKLGIGFYLLAALWQYHWAFFFTLAYLGIYFANRVINKDSNSMLYFPPGMRNKRGTLIMILLGLTPILIIAFQRLAMVTFSSGISPTNSNLLYRVGIDSITNIHHGGLLAAFQFLGGNRVTVCLLGPALPIARTIGNANIFLFNCLFSILGMASISLLAVIGYYYFTAEFKDARWVTVTFVYSFVLFACIFQQTFAVHLQGYSILFCFIFSCGMVSLFNKLMMKLKAESFSNVFIVPFTLAIAIHGVRVSYFTGING